MTEITSIAKNEKSAQARRRVSIKRAVRMGVNEGAAKLLAERIDYNETHQNDASEMIAAWYQAEAQAPAAAPFTVEVQLSARKWHTERFSTFQQAEQFIEGCIARNMKAINVNGHDVSDSDKLWSWVRIERRRTWTNKA